MILSDTCLTATDCRVGHSRRKYATHRNFEIKLLHDLPSAKNFDTMALLNQWPLYVLSLGSEHLRVADPCLPGTAAKP